MNVAFNISDFKIKFLSHHFMEVSFTCNDTPFYLFPRNMRHTIVRGGRCEGSNVLSPEMDLNILSAILSPYAFNIINYMWLIHGVTAIYLRPAFNNMYQLGVQIDPYISFNRRVANGIKCLFCDDIELFKCLIKDCRCYNDRRYFINDTSGDESYFQLFFHRCLTLHKRVLKIHSRHTTEFNLLNTPYLTRYGRKHFYKFRNFLNLLIDEYYEHIAYIYINAYSFSVYYDNDINLDINTLISNTYNDLQFESFKYNMNKIYARHNNGLYIE